MVGRRPLPNFVIPDSWNFCRHFGSNPGEQAFPTKGEGGPLITTPGTPDSYLMVFIDADMVEPMVSSRTEPPLTASFIEDLHRHMQQKPSNSGRSQNDRLIMLR